MKEYRVIIASVEYDEVKKDDGTIQRIEDPNRHYYVQTNYPSQEALKAVLPRRLDALLETLGEITQEKEGK